MEVVASTATSPSCGNKPAQRIPNTYFLKKKIYPCSEHVTRVKNGIMEIASTSPSGKLSISRHTFVTAAERRTLV